MMAKFPLNSVNSDIFQSARIERRYNNSFTFYVLVGIRRDIRILIFLFSTW